MKLAFSTTFFEKSSSTSQKWTINLEISFAQLCHQLPYHFTQYVRYHLVKRKFDNFRYFWKISSYIFCLCNILLFLFVLFIYIGLEFTLCSFCDEGIVVIHERPERIADFSGVIREKEKWGVFYKFIYLENNFTRRVSFY